MQQDQIIKEDVHREQAIRRVSAYFRSLGLDDAQRVRKAAESVLTDVESAHPQLDGEALGFTAVNEARKMVREWLVALVARGDLPEPTTMTTGLIIWRLRLALHAHPQAFLKRRNLPEGFLAAVRCPSPTMLPDSLPGQMDPQRIEWRTVKLPARLVRKVRQLGNVTHDLIYNVVGGR